MQSGIEEGSLSETAKPWPCAVCAGDLRGKDILERDGVPTHRYYPDCIRQLLDVRTALCVILDEIVNRCPDSCWDETNHPNRFKRAKMALAKARGESQ